MNTTDHRARLVDFVLVGYGCGSADRMLDKKQAFKQFYEPGVQILPRVAERAT